MITYNERVAETWPVTAQELRGFLRSRSASAEDCDDILQECVIRVLRARPTFTDAADLVHWCIPVVRNLSVDLYRRGRRETLWDTVPDAPLGCELDEHVSHKLELSRVLRALHQLRPTDREAIVSHVQQDTVVHLDRRQAVRQNVQRHRARQRLLAKLAAIIAAAWSVGRRTTRLAVPAAIPAALALGVLSPQVGPGVQRTVDRPTVAVVTAAPPVAGATARPGAATQRAARRVPAAVDRRVRPAPPVRDRATELAAAPTGDAVRATRRPATSTQLVCLRGVGPVDVCAGSTARPLAR